MPRNDLPFGSQISPALIDKQREQQTQANLRPLVRKPLKEIRLTHFLNCGDIVMVPAGKIGGDERQVTIVVAFIREAHHSMDLNRIDL